MSCISSGIAWAVSSRCYLEHLSSQDPWLSSIQALITLGTPHLGAPLAVEAIMGTLQVPLTIQDVGTIPAATTAAMAENFLDTTFGVSTYELLPPPQIPFIAQGSSTYSVFSLPPAISIPNLDDASLMAAKSFMQTLNYQSPTPPPASIPYYCVYGLSTAAPTCVGFAADASGTLTPITTCNNGQPCGDTVVPASSAQFAGNPRVTTFDGGDVPHVQLAGNTPILQQVARWIGVA